MTETEATLKLLTRIYMTAHSPGFVRLYRHFNFEWWGLSVSGADPEFQVRGGALKKIAPSGGRRENCWGISCEKSRFYAKKSYLVPPPWILT
jgi:hypothetical protein